MYLREDKGASGSMRVTMEDICENLKSKMETLEGLQGGLQKLIAYLKVIYRGGDIPGLEDIKLMFMLNSTEHKISTPHKN